jgi:hypothetical protein
MESLKAHAETRITELMQLAADQKQRLRADIASAAGGQ